MTDTMLWTALALALAPFALVLLTCFAKIGIVLSLLRHALGVPQVPSDRVVTVVALALTFFVMAPTAAEVFRHVEPWLSARDALPPTDLLATAREAVEPMLSFARQHASASELERMAALAADVHGAPADPDAMSTVIGAFLITELNEAFLIGALLFIPFVALDLFVANLLISLGLTGLRPADISLPLKLALFVLADGWFLVVQGLSQGYSV